MQSSRRDNGFAVAEAAGGAKSASFCAPYDPTSVSYFGSTINCAAAGGVLQEERLPAMRPTYSRTQAQYFRK